MTTPLRRFRWSMAGISLFGVAAVVLTVLAWPHRVVSGPATAASVLVSVYLIRLVLVLRTRASRMLSARVVLMAPLLPRPGALRWISDTEIQIVEHRDDGLPCFLHSVVKGLPKIVFVAWRGVVVARLERVRDWAARCLMMWIEPRLTALELFLQSKEREWPTTARQTAAMVWQCYQLRRWGWLLSTVPRADRCQELVAKARWLRQLSDQLHARRQAIPLPPHKRGASHIEISRLLGINRARLDLLELLHDAVTAER